MPNKTIYVKESDLSIFDRALELSGEDSISSVIADALRRYVAAEELKQEGFEEIIVKEGSGAEMAKKMFVGKEIAWFSDDPAKKRPEGTDYTLYLTKKGKFVLEVYEWSRWEDSIEHSHIYVEDHLGDVDAPQVLLQEAAKKLGREHDVIEYMDI